MSRSEEIAAATARREEIINSLLELMTGPLFSTKELRHYQAVSSIFGVEPVVREMCSTASTLDGRTELALAVVLAAIGIALDSTPPAPSAAHIERRERREAEKQWKETVVAAANKPEPEPVKSSRPLSQEYDASYKRKRRENMNEEQLTALRAAAALRQRERRSRLRASRTV